jgi:hypothetical protein
LFTIGHTVSEETRRKLSEGVKKAWADPDGNLRKVMTGHTVSKETRAKIGAANKISLKGRKNKPCSEETKRKIGEGNKGKIKPHSEEWKRKQSKTMEERFSKDPTHLEKLMDAGKKWRDAHPNPLHRHKKMPPTIIHFEKYLEIHGEDKAVIMLRGEHLRLHRRLRKEGRCNIPKPELKHISAAAHKRLRRG